MRLSIGVQLDGDPAGSQKPHTFGFFQLDHLDFGEGECKNKLGTSSAQVDQVCATHGQRIEP